MNLSYYTDPVGNIIKQFKYDNPMKKRLKKVQTLKKNYPLFNF